MEELIGKWKINREMTDPNGSPKGTMRGMGQFDLYEGNQLIYQEQLWHETDKEDLFFATKFYRYHFSDDSIDIYFYKEENNRLFLTLQKDELKGSASCKADNYSLVWDWINKDHFLTCYKAIGPKKNYIIESEFSR